LLQEINFDGIVGPSHNYAGLSLGNIASASHKGDPSYPRAAALQGIAKMRGNMERGLAQGYLLPLPRPNFSLLQRLGVDEDTDRALRAAAWSASSMWTANAATVSPAPDTADGRCHLTPANLVTMLHRGQEWRDTQAQLKIAFGNRDHFAVHDAVPPSFGDEGAANHMRFCEGHGSKGVEVFVYGRPGGRFPARQHEQASRAVARLHGLDPDACIYIEQNPEAIEAGAFHNVDVRQSMANGGGPACLRLRVVADPATVDARFLLDEQRAERIESVIAQTWPEQIDPADIGKEALAKPVIEAREALLAVLSLDELA
jgi:succinylarginine dihydrolase